MSQFYIDQSVAPPPIPPTVPTSFVTDSGTAVPAANVLNDLGATSTVNNANGIQTTGSGNTVTTRLTNRFSGSATTVGATTADVITFALGATPASFFFNFTTAVFNASTPAAAGYDTYTTLITDGVTATVIGDTDAIVHESAALIATNAELVASGNNAIFRATGVAGLTIDWVVVGTYVEAT